MKTSVKSLTPTQEKVKTPRRVIYSGDKQNCDPAFARDVITLYCYCGLGYSAIRHITNAKSDKRIEDIIRQHMLGRTNVDGSIGEIYCPAHKDLTSTDLLIIENIAKSYYPDKYDEYVTEMLEKGTWYDDPLYPKMERCENCNETVSSDWMYCPHCGASLSTAEEQMRIVMPIADNAEDNLYTVK